MRLDRAAIPLEARDLGSCIDLAAAFIARHPVRILLATQLAVVPPALAIFTSGEPHWVLVTVLTVLCTAPLETALIHGATSAAFGESSALRSYGPQLRQLAAVLLRSLLVKMAMLLGGVLCLAPGVLVAVRWGFVVESRLLSRLNRLGHDRRTSELITADYSQLVTRRLTLAGFWAVLWVVMLLTLDCAATLLLGVSPLVGRLVGLGQDIGSSGDPEVFFHDLWSLATTDRWALLLQVEAFLMLYPLLRLAWYFCYIDLRVRIDCWDLELAMSRAVQELETPA